MSVFFNGQKWTTPGVMSRIDDEAMYNNNLNIGNVAAFIGRSEGGQPKTAMRFGSPSEARNTLLSGDLLTAIEQAFDPSAETNAPSQIVAIRVNPAVQASAEVKDSSGFTTVMKLFSTDYGRRANSIRYKIETGTESGKKITTQLGDTYYTADNISRYVFSIQYSGTEASATMTVTNTSVILSAPAGVEADVIDLHDYETVQKLVDRINTVPGFTADVVDSNGEQDALNGLDLVSALDVRSTKCIATAHVQAIVDWFNGLGEGFITAERVTGIYPGNTPWKYLEGGSDGNVNMSDWQDCFDVLQTQDVQWITPLSSEPAIHAMCDTHASYMSTVGRKERRAMVGGKAGVTDKEAIAAAKALASDRVSYVHLGMYDYNSAGKLTLFPPYILAAKIAGMFSGVTPGYSLTKRTVKIRGIERNLKNPTDTDPLINGGVLCVENTDDGYKIVQSITTWRANNKYTRVEVSTGAAVDYIARTVRERVERLIGGTPGSPTKLSIGLQTADTALRQLTTEGIIVGDEKNPSFRNLTASLEGDALQLEFEASPGIPVNYVLVTIHCVPYSGSVSA